MIIKYGNEHGDRESISDFFGLVVESKSKWRKAKRLNKKRDILIRNITSIFQNKKRDLLISEFKKNISLSLVAEDDSENSASSDENKGDSGGGRVLDRV